MDATKNYSNLEFKVMSGHATCTLANWHMNVEYGILCSLVAMLILVIQSLNEEEIIHQINFEASY